MKEELYYISIANQLHFVHEHRPDEVKDIPYIFLNPVFDEKKRSQRFYAQTARWLCKKGTPVIRFDYYGTDDSCGQLYEFSFNNIKNTIIELINKVKGNFQCQKINLFGLRMGADLAITITENHPDSINDLILIEPIINGKRYLTEQRSRRKMFFKLNNMTDVQEKIEIEGKIYEDHQGYLISMDNLGFLDNLDSTKTNLNQKNIILLKLNTISSRKLIGQLKEKLETGNSVTMVSYSCDDFWANLEPIDTIGLTEKIIEKSCKDQVTSEPK